MDYILKLQLIQCNICLETCKIYIENKDEDPKKKEKCDECKEKCNYFLNYILKKNQIEIKDITK